LQYPKARFSGADGAKDVGAHSGRAISSSSQQLGVVVDAKRDQAMLTELALPEFGLVPARIHRPGVPRRVD
jgi:hypothetical protein